MMQWLPQISWFEARNLMWLLLVPLMCPVLIWGYLRTQRRLTLAQSSVTEPNGRWVLLRVWSYLKGVVFLLALTLLIISSAGPRLGWTWIESKQSGVDIVVAVDVSRSMLARDLEPNRLERARRMILDLLDVAEGDRIGLVVFAGAAFVQCPLTVDHGAMRSFVDGLSTDMIPVSGTDLAGALKESLKALDAGGEKQGMGKLIVLMTDGEDHTGGIDGALEEVAKSKAKVVTVGLASAEGSPVIDEHGGFIKDQSGDVVVSRLNDAPLRKIARETDGDYLDAAAANSSIAVFYQDVIRAKGTVRETQSKKERVWFERFQWTAALAFFLMLLEYAISDMGRAKSAVIVFLFLSVMNQRAAWAGDSSVERYNKAVLAFESGDEEIALREFSELAKTGDGEVRRRSLYNLGNLMAASGQYDEAAKVYEEALSMDYQDQQVRDNLAWVRQRSPAKDDQSKQQQKNGESDQNDQTKNKEEKQPESQGQKQSQNQQKTNPSQQEKGDQKESDSQEQKEKQSDAKPGGSDSRDNQSLEKSEKKEDRDKSPGQAMKGQEDMTPEQAEKLLRAAPDDRKTFVPIFRSEKAPQRGSQGKNW